MSNYESLDHIMRYEHQNKSNKNIIPIHCQYVNISLFIFIIIINISILTILIMQLYTFSHLFKSFKSNLHEDIENFNEFLQVIPQLKDVLNIISNLCNIQAVQPYCNNQTSPYLMNSSMTI